MLVVVVGFVIFRADTLGEACEMIGQMFAGFTFTPAQMSFALMQLTPYFIVMFAAAVFFCGPAERLVKRLRAAGEEEQQGEVPKAAQTVLYVIALILLCWCVLRLSGGAYNPFISFRF